MATAWLVTGSEAIPTAHMRFGPTFSTPKRTLYWLTLGAGTVTQEVPPQCAVKARSVVKGVKYRPTAQTSLGETTVTPNSSSRLGPLTGSGEGSVFHWVPSHLRTIAVVE